MKLNCAVLTFFYFFGGFMTVTDEGPVVEYAIMEDIRVEGEPKLHMSIDNSRWYPVECAIENYANCNRSLLDNYFKKLRELET